MNERRAPNRAECQSLGISGTRALLLKVSDVETRANILEWIDEHERGEAAAREGEQRAQNERAIQAATLSAETSREAATASVSDIPAPSRHWSSPTPK
jgi:hypothetical protein